VPGFSSDGSLAATALLSGPTDVALDGKGNVYVAEAGNDRVRMINAAGILSTVAGGGTGGDGGPATSAKLSDPTGIAIDGHSAELQPR
jgi:DNA-binding beta-propeller fold protein YncE